MGRISGTRLAWRPGGHDLSGWASRPGAPGQPVHDRVGYVAVSQRRVLLLAANLFEDMELLYPLYRLTEEDIAVTVAGLDTRPVTGKKGHGPVAVDTTVEQVTAGD